MKAGWNTKTLGDVCDFLRGLTYAKSDEVAVSSNIVLRATNIDLETNQLDLTELKYINDKVAVPVGKKVRKGSLLICTASGSKSHLGKVALIDDDYDFAFGGFMGMLTPCSELAPKFLFHLMTSGAYKDFIATLSDGANINNLKFSDLQRFVVPVPPLSEQQRIVAILDEAFAAIAAARANAEQNRQNARALFESYLQSVFSQRGEGWVEKSLGDLATFRNGVNFTKSSRGESIKILGVKDFQNYFWASLNELESIIPDGILSDTDMLQQDDIVFVRSNGNPELIGRCLLIGEVNERVTFSGFTIRARRFTEEVLPQYLCHFLKSSHVRKELVDGGNGANIRSLNQGALSRLRINFPAELSEQKHIIEQLEIMQSETQRLESLYQRKIEALDELKQSLLQQAFSGQL